MKIDKYFRLWADKSTVHFDEVEPFESRPKGKWIIKRDCEEVIVTCSNCGAKDYIPTTIDGRFYFNRNYCWDCGADMRGEELYKGDEVRRMVDKEIEDMGGKNEQL